MTRSGQWDPGLQPERSRLAWKRTALGITAGLTVAARVLSSSHLWFGIALPLTALAAGAVLFAASGSRSARIDRWLRTGAGERDPAPGGRLPLALAVFAALLAAAGGCVVLTGR